ncbi:MAG: tRNA (adenosine(37)-N6)-dimethylallyltransferase MiaA [Bacillota bacterium]
MVIVIGGSTATGKTKLATAVAKEVGGELISADSMQIYTGMDIGTAKENASQLGVPIHMIDVVDPKCAYSVVEYKENALRCIKDIESRGKTPIIVGGTGLYITSLLYKMDYGTQIDPEVRISLENELEMYGKIAMHNKLLELDPTSAEKIHYNNVKRMMRALEVCVGTGGKFSEQNVEKVAELDCDMYSLIASDRDILLKNIAKRVDIMLKSGLESEIKTLLDSGVTFDMQSMQGIGYKEWNGYFDNKISIEEVRDAIVKNTRAYAKRQDTWFRLQYPNATIFDPYCTEFDENLAKILKKRG